MNELDRTRDANLAEAKRYLEGIASTVLKGCETTIATDAGSVAERIFATIQSFHIDLVVINSHGYTGFKRWVLGSVAEKVARHVMVLILILREHNTSAELHSYNEGSTRVLVPLDGSMLITDAHLTGLPEFVQRYLRHAGAVGKAPICTVRLKQLGWMRQQPGKKWMRLIAEQSFTTKPPAFLWHCTMRPFPLVWVSAMDQFFQGNGSMRIKLLSAVSMGNAHGPEMDQSEMQHYLSEMIWFPTAWLTSAIEWQAIDAHSVKATLHASGVTASVVLHVNEEGQVTHVTTDRYKEEHGHYLLAPWSGQRDAYQEVEGMRIPTRITIAWHLASGEFTWFRCKITEIEYNQSGKATVL